MKTRAVWKILGLIVGQLFSIEIQNFGQSPPTP